MAWAVMMSMIIHVTGIVAFADRVRARFRFVIGEYFAFFAAFDLGRGGATVNAHSVGDN